ncbi:hypothetical protein GGI04_002955 [Coemansia thaxteri]|uniref:NAD-dependent epimerase/dehydratase domain-containing protein n=1 Tax=Coemansia thaxteri TaxID=2663907 RepID=A0A9W8BLT4_9FUNG|nr:hypothetical protein GGI04_002955 [Coemansia thaxteri]KAJ2007233.1 hypothetical protein H4R26_000897 [Coemansia thaxteri]KAJ2473010.1 hypothetical protein GGI02_001178 [Coemansia sp. RSA 2322]
MSAARKLFVVGGSGFLGQAICHSALARGWEVLSLSRHGAPGKALTRDPSGKPAAGCIRWIQGDALKPESFQEHLPGCTAVVHTVGVLMENNYKSMVNMGATSRASRQPPTTYEQANRDTALSVARAARGVQGLDTFVYISASDVLPLISARYISTKREAENDLLAHRDAMRPIILRPGFMFSSVRPVSLPIAAGVSLYNTLYHRTPAGCLLKHTPFAKAASPALRREVVASAVVNAIEDRRVSGVLEIADIERIGNTSVP